MEFIRHIGELQCSNCGRVERNRVIYYCYASQQGGAQLYWFVCGECREWTRLAFGYEAIGPLAAQVRNHIEKIRRFEERNEVERYGTNW